MEYRSNLFRIFSYLFVLSIGVSLIGPVQAFFIPDGQRGPLQSGKIQYILESDLETIPGSGGQLQREDCISGLSVQHQLRAGGLPGKSLGPITGRLQISDIYPSVAVDERRQLLDTMIQKKINKSFYQDTGRSALPFVSGKGTITYIDLEGGFFGIMTDDGAQLRPISLPEEYRVDGLRVRFTAIPRTGTAGIYMWGTAVQLLSIEKDTQSISGSGTITYIDLEGGFFGIITDDGTKYLPLNLPDGYASDGTEVEFTAIIVQDCATTAMWGVPVNLLSITRTGGEDTGEQSHITGSWLCTGYRDGNAIRGTIPGTEIIADFGSDGRITGNCGCNMYFAEYSASGTSLDVGTAGMTEMYCLGPDGVMEQEQLYLTLLCSASTFDVTDGILTIQDETGSDILVFDRIE